MKKIMRYSTAVKKKFAKLKRGSVKERIRKSVLYKLWRRKVYARDNYTCQWCKKQRVYLNADHIKPFALILKENKIKTMKAAEKCEELWDINNGRTLCLKCHKKTETYGNSKFLEKGWQSEEKAENLKNEKRLKTFSCDSKEDGGGS